MTPKFIGSNKQGIAIKKTYQQIENLGRIKKSKI
jgi:hypothetical protein